MLVHHFSNQLPVESIQELQLTHLVVDNNEEWPDFLKELFIEEEKYAYLKKIYDSKSRGFEYQVKVFEINYELFNSLKDNIVLRQK